MLRLRLLLLTVFALAPAGATAQPFENLGTRALGMAGAFVAIADDGSAVAWNPAGLAHGPFFNLLLERASHRREADLTPGRFAVDQSATGFAITTLPLGLSYYRHRYTTAGAANTGSDPAATGEIPISSLVSHHTGVTLLHSLTPALVIGTTVKFVRGVAAVATADAGSTDEALARAVDLVGRASNTFDADLGVMLAAGPFRAGVTLRNATEPSFSAPSGEVLTLERQARAGVAWIWRTDTTLAVDADLTRSALASHPRQVAIGAERRWLSRVALRGGVRFAAEGEEEDPVAALGGSVALRSGVWIDGFWNGGGDDDRAWGVAVRIAY